jgi:hypothetical protein
MGLELLNKTRFTAIDSEPDQPAADATTPPESIAAQDHPDLHGDRLLHHHRGRDPTLQRPVWFLRGVRSPCIAGQAEGVGFDQRARSPLLAVFKISTQLGH